MVRGTFANVRLRNKLAPGTEGGWTRYLPTDEVDDASSTPRRSTRPRATPLIILAGKEYGSGSSRDWAAKGPLLLGVQGGRSPRATSGSTARTWSAWASCRSSSRTARTPRASGLTGEEVFSIENPDEGLAHRVATAHRLIIAAARADGSVLRFPVRVRIDTPQEVRYYENGGILQYVLRQLLTGANDAK